MEIGSIRDGHKRRAFLLFREQSHLSRARMQIRSIFLCRCGRCRCLSLFGAIIRMTSTAQRRMCLCELNLFYCNFIICLLVFAFLTKHFHAFHRMGISVIDVRVRWHSMEPRGNKHKITISDRWRSFVSVSRPVLPFLGRRIVRIFERCARSAFTFVCVQTIDRRKSLTIERRFFFYYFRFIRFTIPMSDVSANRLFFQLASHNVVTVRPLPFT